MAEKVRDYYAMLGVRRDATTEEIKRVYYPESVDLLKRVTGATEVRVFDHTLRRRVPGQNDRSTGIPRQPASLGHVDQTATSGAARLRSAPQDAPPRESIELRTFLIFGEDDKARQ